jgi:hypothetical protein
MGIETFLKDSQVRSRLLLLHGASFGGLIVEPMRTKNEMKYSGHWSEHLVVPLGLMKAILRLIDFLIVPGISYRNYSPLSTSSTVQPTTDHSYDKLENLERVGQCRNADFRLSDLPSAIVLNFEAQMSIQFYPTCPELR